MAYKAEQVEECEWGLFLSLHVLTEDTARDVLASFVQASSHHAYLHALSSGSDHSFVGIPTRRRIRGKLRILRGVDADVDAMRAILADCDANPTTALEAALAAARSRPPGTPATIEIRGTCRVNAPVVLTGPLDDGLTIRAATSNVSSGISGGVDVPGPWTVHAEAACKGCGKVWWSPLPPGARGSRQLYIGGVRANRTTMLFPQEDAVKAGAGFLSPLAAQWTHNDGAGIEMLHRGTTSCNMSSRHQWAESRVPVARTDPSSGGTFVMAQPAFTLSNSMGNGLPCLIENIFELLGDAVVGRQRDYYLDVPAGKVYVVSPQPPQAVVLPQSEGLLTLTNTSSVRLSGLALTDATYALDDSGFVQLQAGCVLRSPVAASLGPWWQDGRCMPGSVQVHRGRSCVFEDCMFARLGAAGLSFVDGSQSNAVRGSLFEDISGTAVSIGSIDTYNETNLDRHDAKNTLSDNTVRGVAREFLGSCAITAFFSRGTVIEHNEVERVAYTGISVGWGWTFAMEATWPRMPWDHGNVVAWNRVQYVDGILGDGGSIYTLGVQGNRPFLVGSVRKSYPPLPLPPLEILPMSQIVHNYVRANGWPERPKGSHNGDGSHGPGGLYTDNGSTGWNVSSNVFEDCTVWAVACYTAGIANNSYVNNTLLRTWGPIEQDGQHCVLANNSAKTADSLSPADRAVMAGAGPRGGVQSRWGRSGV